MNFKTDCKFFKGNVPCIPNKKYDVQCDNCIYYAPVAYRILIIKLAAIGDVIRTTPVLTRLRKLYPNALIYWLTSTPDILPDEVDYKLEYSYENIQVLKSIQFDLLLNLDKSGEACSATYQIPSYSKRGFTLLDGKPYPINKAAEHKYITGIFDSVSKANTKSYVEEIFEICEIGEFNNEEYILDVDTKNCIVLPSKSLAKVIGLNTGCSDRWKSRLWDLENWVELAEKLIDRKYEVVLLGGENENINNKYIAKKSGAKYFGTFPIKDFISIVNFCDLVVSQVTLVAHIAIALKKKLVLMNNIFNKHEFYLYGRGKIIEPDINCNCFYSPVCKNDCMKYITVATVLQTIGELM